MKTVGIIAEYNPFHSGHRYQFDHIRALTGADYIVVVMSGDFVQRGEPAVYDKYTRTAVALGNGADLVLEMPAAFATSSAEDFSACAVAMLDRLGVVDYLCFGSEAGGLSVLQQAAQLLVKEPEEYKAILRERQRAGASFPKAREEALSFCLRRQNSGLLPENTPDLGEVISSPNNILGIEYLKALLRRGSRIQPVTIKRIGQDYHQTRLPSDASFPSASAIRRAIRQEAFDYFREFGYDRILSAAGSDHPGSRAAIPPALFADDLTAVFNWKLLELCSSRADLTAYADLSPEMAARLENQALDFASFTERVEQLKTRQYTYTRISRALLHLLLDITTRQIADSRAQDYVSYLRILGFRRSALPLLTLIKQTCPLPLITKTARARKILDDRSFRLLCRDLTASHLYQSLQFQKSGIRPKNEYTSSIVIL